MEQIVFSHREFRLHSKLLSVLCLVLRQPVLFQPGKGPGEPVLKRDNWLVLEVALGRRDVKPPVDDEHFHLNRATRQDGREGQERYCWSVNKEGTSKSCGLYISWPQFIVSWLKRE